MTVIALRAEPPEVMEVESRITEVTLYARGAVELPPHGRRAVTLEYRVNSQRGVAGV